MVETKISKYVSRKMREETVGKDLNCRTALEGVSLMSLFSQNFK